MVEIETIARKWGDSIAVIIPKNIVESEKIRPQTKIKIKLVTGLMNLYEFYYIVIKENNSELAEEFFNRLISSCVKINPSLVKEVANFRFKEIKRKLSYIDCLGYVIAKENKIKFFTGDIGFKGMTNVKFVE